MATKAKALPVRIVRAKLPTIKPTSIDVGLPVLGRNGEKALDTAWSTQPNEPLFEELAAEHKFSLSESS